MFYTVLTIGAEVRPTAPEQLGWKCRFLGSSPDLLRLEAWACVPVFSFNKPWCDHMYV